MKKYIVFIVLMSSLSESKLYAQTDPAYDSIVALNLNHYAGLPVDSFLNRIPVSYNYLKIMGYTKGDRAHGLGIEYPTGMIILIYPKNFSHMNPIDPAHVWNLALFKKEIATYITVIHPSFKALTGQYP